MAIDPHALPTEYASPEDFWAAAIGLFGPTTDSWRFRCPVCGYVAEVREWRAVGAETSIAFSCVGRWREGSRRAFGGEGPGPCDYAGGGLFQVNPVTVRLPAEGRGLMVFQFAPTVEDEK